MELNKIKTTAFTLIELLVVIAIIGILSGLIIVGMNNSIQSATIAKAQIFSASLRDSLLINLVSEWKFDGSSIVDTNPVTNGSTYLQDSWSTGNNCTIGGGGPSVYSGSNCVYGSCLLFNGTTDYLNCTNSSLVQEITLEAWIKVTGTRPTVYTAPARQGSTSFMFYVNNEGNTNKLVDWLGRNSTNTTWLYWLHASYNVNEWTHIVGTFSTSGGFARYYKNGVLVDSVSSLVGPLFSSTNTLAIGSSWSGGYFSGNIDQVRIYNAAIPASQIKEQYYAGLNHLLAKGEIKKADYLNGIK